MLSAENWQLVRFSGQDAESFLQGHLTCDLRRLIGPAGCLAAACDDKGRVLASMYVFRQSHREGAGFRILLPKEVWSSLAHFWRRYFVLYRRAEMQEEEGYCCVQEKADRPEEEPLLSFGLPSSNRLLLLPRAAQAGLASGNDLSWDARLIEDAVPHIYADGIGKWIPQMLHYDRMDAVSYTKGCYLGQEVVARVHYRGKPNRLCRRVAFASSQPPYVYMPFYNVKHETMGNLVSCYADGAQSYKGLAVLSANLVDLKNVLLRDKDSFREIEWNLPLKRNES